MEEYANFHRGIKVSRIPKFTWALKELVTPFSQNQIITIEERGQGSRTFKDCGSAKKSDMFDDEGPKPPTPGKYNYGKFDTPINTKFQKKILFDYTLPDELEYKLEDIPAAFLKKLFPF